MVIAAPIELFPDKIETKTTGRSFDYPNALRHDLFADPVALNHRNFGRRHTFPTRSASADDARPE
jgi:hypothetical protein